MNAYLILWDVDQNGQRKDQIASKVKRLPQGLSPFVGLILSDDYNEYEVVEVDVPIDREDGRRPYSVILIVTSKYLNREPLKRLGWEWIT